MSAERVAAEPAELIVPNVDAWRGWLRKNHRNPQGVWLVLSKRGATQPTSLTYDQALEEALAHGWIDGQAKTRDDVSYRQRFTPRRTRSQWSQRNVGIVERLTAAGHMHPAGLAEVKRAKADGRWDRAYGGRTDITVQPDLMAALRANRNARAMFDRLSGRNRFAILYRIESAKRAETRARRIERFVAMLARGETVYPQKHGLADARR